MTTGENMCPDEALLHAFVDDRDETLSASERATLDAHLAGCDSCDEVVADLRRFRTLLLRARVPGLDEDQWQNLDTRVEMMAGEPAPRGNQTAGRIYWGLAIAAAVSLFAVGGWQLMNKGNGGPTTVLSETGQARVAGAFTPVQVAITEGSMEFAGVDGQFHPVQPGEKLARGSQLRSRTGGRLVVAKNFEIRLGADSTVAVLAGNKREIFLRLRHGAVSCRVDKRRPGQKFGVLAGGFRTRVLGTEFTVTHDHQGRVAVEVSEGAVRVDKADDPWRTGSETTSVVRAGHRWRFTAGHMELGPIVATPSLNSDRLPKVAGPVAPAAKTDAPSNAPALTKRHLPHASKRDESAARGRHKQATRRHHGAATSHGRARHHGAAPAAASAGAVAGADDTVFAVPPPPMALPPAPHRPASKSASKARNADGRRILINVPPQAMTAEEVRRAKAAEKRRGHGPSADRRLTP